MSTVVPDDQVVLLLRVVVGELDGDHALSATREAESTGVCAIVAEYSTVSARLVEE